MHLPRPFSAALATLFVVAFCGIGRADLEEDEKAETIAQMHRVWQAIMAFKKDHGELPDHLSDLVPGYLANGDALVSPTEKRTSRHGDNNYQDPKIRSSFCYEFSAGKFAGQSQSFREVKQAQMEEFGGVVPILRCFLYRRPLNIAYSGDFYESELYWEKAPEAKAVTERIGPGPGFKNGEFAAMTVVDAESGAPVADAEVRLTQRSYHALPLPDRVLRTAADGTVRIPLGPALPPSRRLTLSVSKAGYFSPPEMWQEGSLPEEAVMGLERGVTGGGVLTLEDGTPLGEARIELVLTPAQPRSSVVPGPRVFATATTDASGKWSSAQLPKELAGVTLRVRHPQAWTTEFACAEKGGAGMVATADLLKSVAALRVPPAGSLHGRLAAADGTPVAGAEIQAVAIPDPKQNQGVSGNDGAAAPGSGVTTTTKTDAQGRYALPWGEAGRVVLLGFPREGAPARVDFETAPRMPVHDLRSSAGREIRGRVLDRDDHPAAGVKVRLCEWAGKALPDQKQVAETDAAGEFSWPVAPPEKLVLRFVHPAFFERTAAVDRTEGALTVRVFSRAGP